jgi:hypothetical protein
MDTERSESLSGLRSIAAIAAAAAAGCSKFISGTFEMNGSPVAAAPVAVNGVPNENSDA